MPSLVEMDWFKEVPGQLRDTPLEPMGKSKPPAMQGAGT
jgi:hypothetical protein